MHVLHGIANDLFEGVGCKADAIRLEELVLKLDPVQTEGVQEAFQNVHHQENPKGDPGKQSKAQIGGKPTQGHRGQHALLPKDLGEFRVSE